MNTNSQAAGTWTVAPLSRSARVSASRCPSPWAATTSQRVRRLMLGAAMIRSTR